MLKKQLLLLLTVVSFVWAIVMTIQYYELKKNPLFIHFNDNPLPSLGNEAGLQKLESIQFLRQFSDKLLNYDSSNFWQTQLTLTNLMGEKLQVERKSEIQRLKKNIEQKNYSQHGELISLQLLKSNIWSGVYKISAQESGKQEQFAVNIQFQLSQIQRSLENPWGLFIQEMKVSSLPAGSNDLAKPKLNIAEHSPLLLIFPCPLQNIEVSNQEPLSFKLTTLNTTEVQVLQKHDFQDSISGKAICQNGFFPFEITAHKSDDHSALYQFVSEQMQKSVPKTARQQKSKEIKTIEEELGFVIEEK